MVLLDKKEINHVSLAPQFLQNFFPFKTFDPHFGQTLWEEEDEDRGAGLTDGTALTFFPQLVQKEA